MKGRCLSVEPAFLGIKGVIGLCVPQWHHFSVKIHNQETYQENISGKVKICFNLLITHCSPEVFQIDPVTKHKEFLVEVTKHTYCGFLRDVPRNTSGEVRESLSQVCRGIN
jgi:hypothetical protein